jgi:hypothetical protein
MSTAPMDPGLNPTRGPWVTAVEAIPPVTGRGLMPRSRLVSPALKVSMAPLLCGDELLRGEDAPARALGGMPVVFLIAELSLAYGEMLLSFEVSA